MLIKKKPWKGCKPNFVCAGCPAERIIYLLRPYPGLEPFPIRGRTAPCPLFGLAPDGVCRAASLALGAVGSYPAFSPLPRPKPWRYIFCGTFRQPTLASELPECISGGTGVTRHRVLRCSDFPLPAIAESDPPPFQGGDRLRGFRELGKEKQAAARATLSQRSNPCCGCSK